MAESKIPTQKQDHWTIQLACLGPIGHFPKAPGTVGTLAAVPWTIFLLSLQSKWAFVLLLILSVAFAIWCCHQAEIIYFLQKDLSFIQNLSSSVGYESSFFELYLLAQIFGCLKNIIDVS